MTDSPVPTARELIEAAKAAPRSAIVIVDLRDRAEESFEAALEALTYCEWCGVRRDENGIMDSICPDCAAVEGSQHSRECMLRRALAAMDGRGEK